MKKLSTWLLGVLVICLLAGTALAASGTQQANLAYRDITVNINGQPWTPADVNGVSKEPFIIDGTAYVPIRALAETMGYEVIWNDELSSIDVVYKGALKADDVIESVSVLGTVDWDHSKAQAIAVKYKVDMTGANVGVDTYKVNDYGTSLVPVAESTGDAGQGGYASNGNGIQPGAPMKVYVNDKPEMNANGGTGTGNYVIIELNTDYWTPFFPKDWRITMAADVTQVGAIQTASGMIAPGSKAVVNYTLGETTDRGVTSTIKLAKEGLYSIEGIDKYELHMLDSDKASIPSESAFYANVKDAFHATNCFDEADGEYWNLDLPYALYVPEDYDASKEYALLLHFHDASTMGTNPLFPLTEARGPYNFASDAFQQLYKDQGLGGCIVVCPAIAANYEAVNARTGEVDTNHIMRVTTDNWTVTCVLPATWQLMDSITEKYNIDENRIYGTGQSMGGMGVLEMAAQRDNYFAAVMAMSCKWGANYNKEEVYGGRFGATTHGYFATPTQAADPYSQIPALDADGKETDYQNWYYRISDDNIFFVRTIHEMKELHVLYEDLTGIDYPQLRYSVDYDSTHEESRADRLALAHQILGMENPTGFYEIVWEGDCSHNAAWMLGHDTWAIYEWCAQRTRAEENQREKLWNLANDFELADVQKTDFDHSNQYLAGGIPTGKLGAGTGNYNSYVDATHYAGWMKDENGNTYQIGWTKDDQGNWYNTAGDLIYNETDRNSAK